MKKKVLELALTIALAGVGQHPPSAWAATLTVCPPAGLLPAGCYPTIAGALSAAADGDTIEVPAGRFVERLSIRRSVTIRGVNFDNTNIDGGREGGPVTVHVDGGATVTLEHLRITGAVLTGIENLGTLTLQSVWVSDNGDHSASSGGGINNQGRLTINNSVIHHNEANSGGGIDNQGWLVVNSSRIDDNQAGDRFSCCNNDLSGLGGGLFNRAGGRAELVDSTLESNFASRNGGGIVNGLGVTLVLRRTGVIQNEAQLRGGGLYNQGEARLFAATIALNVARGRERHTAAGGGVFNDTLRGKISLLDGTSVAGNTPDNCLGC